MQYFHFIFIWNDYDISSYFMKNYAISSYFHEKLCQIMIHFSMNSFIFLWTLKFHFIFSWTRACIVILPNFVGHLKIYFAKYWKMLVGRYGILFDIVTLVFGVCNLLSIYLLSVTRYLLLVIWSLPLLVKTWFLSLLVVRLALVSYSSA